jgi:threonine dehydrogenase-like Zn-dependent dehydrogenase
MQATDQNSMTGAVLPGNSTVELHSFEVPEPGHGEVLLRTKAASICGSDIRAIYHEHRGKGPEAYQPGTVAGHEPCGQIERCGPGVRCFAPGDRVVVYHISGCGVCNDCRRGYMISCDSEWRRAYGWQRHGGMAPYMVVEEKDLVPLPDNLTYLDGAQIACGFGTVYEALEKIAINGNHAVLITGLGPVGLATAMLARALGAEKIIGVEMNDYRLDLAKQVNLCDALIDKPDQALSEVERLTNGRGVERAIDCSASEAARRTCIQATRARGACALVGEGGTCSFEPSPELIHGQKTLYGSWVTSTWRMEELAERLSRWDLHPEQLVTHRFQLTQADQAYALMSSGECGKVAVTFE